MRKLITYVAAASMMALTACGGAADSGNQTDDFAARIGSSDGSAAAGSEGTVAPSVAQSKPGAAPGPFVAGTHTDPNSACKAPKVGSYIGKLADDPTRSKIMEVIAGAIEVRFIQPGATFINPDPTNPRLNVMLDQQGIIRDARCG